MTTSPSTASLGGVDRGRSASLNYFSPLHEATIEDRRRVYGHNILPYRPSKRLLIFIWLSLHDKVLVSLKIAPFL
jgi:Ca2+-transporting ATPase